MLQTSKQSKLHKPLSSYQHKDAKSQSFHKKKVKLIEPENQKGLSRLEDGSECNRNKNAVQRAQEQHSQ